MRSKLNIAAAIRVGIGAAAVLLSGACGSSTTTAPSPNTFHAEVTDPAGDVAATAGVPHPPDLLHGTVDVSGGTATFTLQFAPGTIDRQAINVVIDLDTDQNPSTGQQALTGGGIDYQVGRTAGTTVGFVSRYAPASCATGAACFTNIGQASVTFGTDTITISVPLSMLGDASGRMNYVVFASVADVLPGGGLTTVGDAMPDNGLPAAHVP